MASVSTTETTSATPLTEKDAAPRVPTGPAAMSTANKKRPKLDLELARERKRGKSMFGILLGTLNKAKIEDKERNASEAAKKRQLIEQRLQSKLRKETDSVRRAEEAKKDKTLANRREEDLQFKDSVYKLRRTRLPLLCNFLLTSDNISSDDSSLLQKDALAPPPRSHPPPLYYLPAILTPAQEDFLKRRKAEVQEAIDKEWSAFCTERSAGIEEIKHLRQRVVEAEERRKAERAAEKDAEPPVGLADQPTIESNENKPGAPEPDQDVEMQVDTEDVGTTKGGKDGGGEDTPDPDRKDEPVPIQADDDDAVEY